MGDAEGGGDHEPVALGDHATKGETKMRIRDGTMVHTSTMSGMLNAKNDAAEDDAIIAPRLGSIDGEGDDTIDSKGIATG